MSKIPYHYFTQSPTYARSRPFGNEYHYIHNINERYYIFTIAELMRMRIRREEKAIQRNAEAILEELITQEIILRMNKNT